MSKFITIENSKVLLLALTVLLCLQHSLSAQRMTGKTNELSLNFKEKGLVDSGPLPIIEWVNPKLEFTNSTSNKIEVVASVKANTPLKEIKLIISKGVDEAIISTKKFPTNPEQRDFEIRTNANLPDGANYLTVEVVTDRGAVVSERRQIVVGKDALENFIALDRKDYVLLFATDKYDHWDDLVNPVHDARAIANEL